MQRRWILCAKRGENMTFDETDFAKRVPKKILDRTKENMEVYNMGLYDSFKEAVRELSKTAF